MKALKDALRFTLSKAYEFTLWTLAKSLACLRLCCNLIYTYAKKACANVPHYVVLTTGQVLMLSIVAVMVVSGVAWCIASIHYSLEIDVLEEAVRNPENPRTRTPKTRRSKVIFEENALGQLCIAFDDSQDEKDTKEDPIQEEEEPTAEPRASDAWRPPAVKTCSDRSTNRLLQGPVTAKMLRHPNARASLTAGIADHALPTKEECMKGYLPGTTIQRDSIPLQSVIAKAAHTIKEAQKKGSPEECYASLHNELMKFVSTSGLGKTADMSTPCVHARFCAAHIALYENLPIDDDVYLPSRDPTRSPPTKKRRTAFGAYLIHAHSLHYDLRKKRAESVKTKKQRMKNYCEKIDIPPPAWDEE